MLLPDAGYSYQVSFLENGVATSLGQPFIFQTDGYSGDGAWLVLGSVAGSPSRALWYRSNAGASGPMYDVGETQWPVTGSVFLDTSAGSLSGDVYPYNVEDAHTWNDAYIAQNCANFNVLEDVFLVENYYVASYYVGEGYQQTGVTTLEVYHDDLYDAASENVNADSSVYPPTRTG